MSDVIVELKEFNVEFDDTNTSKSANIVSGHDIKESFATIHKRLNNIGYTFGTEYISMGSSADLNNYKTPGIYACTSNSPTITHGPNGVTNFKLFIIEGQYEGSIIQYVLSDGADAIYSRVGVNIDAVFSWISDWKRLGEQIILSYGNSTWDDFYNAYIHNAVVYCRASSNNNPATGSQTRLAFMAYVNNGTDPTEVEFQYYRSVSSHSDSQQGDQVFIYKLVKNSGWSVTTREASSKIAVTAPIAKSYSSGTITLSHATSGVTAGTYDSVTVDANGHVTAGTSHQQAEINYAINTGVKNILKITERYKEHQGVTFTVNTDESVSISGGTTGTNSFIRLTGSQSSTDYTDQVPIPKGKYKISCPNATSTDTFVFVIGYRESSGDTRNTLQANSGNDFTNEFEITTDTGRFDATLLSYSTVSSYSATVYPMIRMAEITDNTFEPYAKTNAELTIESTNQQAEINYAINTGSKNLLKTHRASGTSTTGLTFTLNDDGTYNLGGTTTSDANITAICTLADLSQEWIGKQVTLSGAVNSNIRLAVYNGNTLTDFVDSGSGVDFTITQEMISNPYTIRLLVASSTDCSGKVIKPMLRDASISDSTYESYAPTNKILYDSLNNLSILRGTFLDATSINQIDLDTLLNVGRYYAELSNSQYITHKPNDTIQAGFQLTIEENQLENRFVETFTYNNASYTGQVYKRWYTASGWSSWYLFSNDYPTSSVALAICDTAGTEQDKVATISSSPFTWTREIGSIVGVKFTNTNTYNANSSALGTGSITLNVNGTGAANIYYGSTADPTGTNTAAFGYANRYTYYMWDGTYWVWLSQSTDNNTTYSAITQANITNGSGTNTGLITGQRAKQAVDKFAFGTNASIPTNSDLNDSAYSVPGVWSIDNNLTIANVPALTSEGKTIGGRLETITTRSDSYLLQIYYAQGSCPQVYVRRRYNTWEDWTCLNGGAMGIIITGATGTEDDLDNFITPGIFNCQYLADAKKFLHTPFQDADTPISTTTGYDSSAFKLTVEYISSSNIIRQTLITVTAKPRYFIRNRTPQTSGGTTTYVWQTWHVFEGTAIT